MFGAVKAAPEAEADPAVLYGGHYGYGLGGYGGHYGYGLGGYGGYYGHAGAVQAGAVYANGWTDGPNNGVGPAVHAIGKREAEAEAEADPAVLYAGAYGGHYGGLYGGLRGYGYGLGHAYGGLRGYGYGLGHAYGYGRGYYGHHAGAVQVGALYANGWTDGPNNGVGPVVHAIGKREAEAEADPAVLYAGAYGGHYGGLYGGYYGGLRGYGYGLGHAYGLGYGHRLGYYGHHAGAVQAGAVYANGWTDGPNNGLGPVYGK